MLLWIVTYDKELLFTRTDGTAGSAMERILQLNTKHSHADNIQSDFDTLAFSALL